MIVRSLRVRYICTKQDCGQIISLITQAIESRDITDIWLDINRGRSCCYCDFPMTIREINCVVAPDRFGDDLYGEWLCKNHPLKAFYPMPLRKAYEKQIHGQSSLYQYNEIIALDFPWKCPTCKDCLTYVDRRDFKLAS